MKKSKLKKLGLDKEQISYVKSLKSKKKQLKKIFKFLLSTKDNGNN